ncbi:MAG: amylo-alpha-1,6-glucosidase [Candidatus Saccharibacteria bacterium]
MENKQTPPQGLGFFWDMGLNAVKELESDEGILASGREELYGCIFGRDSLITSLKLLRVYRTKKIADFLPLVRKVLLNLALLQGREANAESGEQPGKCIHEFRRSNHEHLTQAPFKPWYLYPDRTMRNYDSVDSTPLFLIAVYRYWQASGDGEFLRLIGPQVEAALNWILMYADADGDGLVDYSGPLQRKFGGLMVQNWMDSIESVFHEDGTGYDYPLAPVEVQAYAYLALKLWSRYFADAGSRDPMPFLKRAEAIKKAFPRFETTDPDGNYYLAFAIDGKGRQFRPVRSSMGHCLWASLNMREDGVTEGILSEEKFGLIVKRLMAPDMFEPEAGIRTLSSYSRNFHPNSYHNGSIWPHDNSLIAEGFEIHGFRQEAALVRRAVLTALGYYKTPVELYVRENNGYLDYCSDTGQRACSKQAWTAAALLDFSSE